MHRMLGCNRWARRNHYIIPFIRLIWFTNKILSQKFYFTDGSTASRYHACLIGGVNVARDRARRTDFRDENPSTRGGRYEKSRWRDKSLHLASLSGTPGIIAVVLSETFCRIGRDCGTHVYICTVTYISHHTVCCFSTIRKEPMPA